MQKDYKEKKERVLFGRNLIDLVFSWSIKDVINHNFYKNQVNQIPRTFSSTTEYLNSFTTPLVEEIHADLSSSVTSLSHSPSRQVQIIRRSKDFKPPKNLFFNIVLKPSGAENKKPVYEPASGDLIAISSSRLNRVSDLEKSFVVAYVQSVKDDQVTLSVLLSNPDFDEENGYGNGNKGVSLFATYLINMTTNIRIWQALTSNPNDRNTKVIERVLQPEVLGQEKCSVCRCNHTDSDTYSEAKTMIESSDLNDSQRNAVLSCISSSECHHRSTVKLIWGPPGTGKTKTVGFLLHSLLKMKRRTLTCAPTNIAVLEVTERLVKRVTESNQYGNYGLGDVVLFGNGERMKIEDREDLCDVFLDHRIDILNHCLSSEIGWKSSLDSMVSLLEDPKNQQIENEPDGSVFEEFIKRRIALVAERLYVCIANLCTHLPTSLISLEVAKRMFAAIESLKSFQKSLISVSNEEFKNVFEEFAMSKDSLSRDCRIARKKSLFLLKLLPSSFPVPKGIRDFLLSSARLIFCTVSSSAKLRIKGMVALEYLVIDEAAQLKECESAIPLQLPIIRNVVLIGDERQLPAMVKSKVAEEAGFGRSLFERLSLLGHKKHLLNVQHRMNPSISLFPNKEFYENKILDGPNVKVRSYNKTFLKGKMFGTYSFINVAHGNEVTANSHSTKNMIEVSVVSEIIESLYKEVKSAKKKVRVGVISPYKAQVHAICERLGNRFSSDSQSEFSVSVRSVDGFQGGEEDVIIISTVRSNKNGSVGFLSNRQRANVALTRARHCLWIVGNGDTLIKSSSVWKNLVNEAKVRRCFHNADEDKNLARAIVLSLFELKQFNFSRNLVTNLFREAKWKVQFDDAFWGSMTKAKDSEFCKEVISMIEKLSSGWRRASKDNEIFVKCSKFIEFYRVKQMYLVWTIDTLKEISHHTQVMKVLNVVGIAELPRISKQFDTLYESYTSDKRARCKYKHIEGDLVVPMRWAVESISEETKPIDGLTKSLTLLNLRTESETKSSSSSTSIRSKSQSSCFAL